MPSLNPLGYFDIGRQIGSARSPASGLNVAIRNILDRARKTGLLQQQARAQGEEARQTAVFKKELDQAYSPTEEYVRILSADGTLGDEITVRPGTSIEKPPSINPLNALIMDMFDSKKKDGNGLSKRIEELKEKKRAGEL